MRRPRRAQPPAIRRESRWPRASPCWLSRPARFFPIGSEQWLRGWPPTSGQRRKRLTASIRPTRSSGFISRSSAPERTAAARPAVSCEPIITMTGVWQSFGSALIARQSSSPLMPGMWRSARIRSGCPFLASSRASSPVSAVTMRAERARNKLASSRNIGRSSATRIVRSSAPSASSPRWEVASVKEHSPQPASRSFASGGRARGQRRWSGPSNCSRFPPGASTAGSRTARAA